MRLVDHKPLKLLISLIPKCFNPNDQCEYHAGRVGHPTKYYTCFKIKV